MSSDFERLVLGDGGAAYLTKPFNRVATMDNSKGDHLAGIPSFLRGEANEPSVKSIPQHLAHDSASHWVGARAGQTSENSTTGKDVSDETAHMTTPASSSAERLSFVAASGTSWNLQRQNILGKGSYGCATLYRVEGEGQGKGSVSPSLPKTQRDPSSLASCHHQLVVVKDINFQTMCNREEEMESLQNEVDVLRASKGHPNCLQYLDYHKANRMAYLITEYCGGRDLAYLLEQRQDPRAHRSLPASPTFAGGAENAVLEHFEESFVASMLIQLSMALYFLHTTQRVLHRDVKPQNLFLLSDGATLRLGDFGTAAPVGLVGETLSVACGSPYYMAPELLEERAYDGGADVWSAGVVLYELMALERPFQASTMQRLVPRILRGDCSRLVDREELRQVYSKPLKELVQSMLTVQPAARPTFRRILRSPYARSHLGDLPRSVLVQGLPYYSAIFGEEVVVEVIGEEVCHESSLQGDGANPDASAENVDEERWNAEYEDDEFEADDE